MSTDPSIAVLKLSIISLLRSLGTSITNNEVIDTLVGVSVRILACIADDMCRVARGTAIVHGTTQLSQQEGQEQQQDEVEGRDGRRREDGGGASADGPARRRLSVMQSPFVEHLVADVVPHVVPLQLLPGAGPSLVDVLLAASGSGATAPDEGTDAETDPLHPLRRRFLQVLRVYLQLIRRTTGPERLDLVEELGDWLRGPKQPILWPERIGLDALSGRKRKHKDEEEEVAMDGRGGADDPSFRVPVAQLAPDVAHFVPELPPRYTYAQPGTTRLSVAQARQLRSVHKQAIIRATDSLEARLGTSVTKSAAAASHAYVRAAEEIRGAVPVTKAEVRAVRETVVKANFVPAPEPPIDARTQEVLATKHVVPSDTVIKQD